MSPRAKDLHLRCGSVRVVEVKDTSRGFVCGSLGEGLGDDTRCLDFGGLFVGLFFVGMDWG